MARLRVVDAAWVLTSRSLLPEPASAIENAVDTELLPTPPLQAKNNKY